ncbi:MAG: 3-methyl-2-oxobutanoate hydroxymethyltransferase [Burkholderiaceae bacterium]|nr:MAG: 3-methyl-2-oxobutanoate hydroxymethyltransferase [Burkholderiaceae bacterium]
MYGNQTEPRKALNLLTLREMHSRGEKIAMLTCYDASFAALLDGCGVDVLLVGDSLGMVLQNETSTLPVTLEQMEYHTRCVARGNQTAWVLTDMPWGSYQESPAQAYASAARLMAAGAQMVKIEGGAWVAPTVEFLVTRGVPVCAHIGLTPQFVHQLGGYRVQGKTDAAAQKLLQEAKTLEAAGADLLLFEAIPAAVAKMLTEAVSIPTIGIGAGADVSGQVLVLHDMLGIFPGRKARFVKNFMEGQPSIAATISAYVTAVKGGSFPAAEHSF